MINLGDCSDRDVMWLSNILLTGRVEVGTTKVLLGPWEKSRLQEKPALIEKPVVVVEKSYHQPRPSVIEKPVSPDAPIARGGGGGGRTLGLDINSFVPVCSFPSISFFLQLLWPSPPLRLLRVPIFKSAACRWNLRFSAFLLSLTQNCELTESAER